MAKISDLSIGTRVSIVERQLGGTIGGEVVEINEVTKRTPKAGKQIGIKLDRHCPIAHSCDGIVEQGYGWWALATSLTVLS